MDENGLGQMIGAQQGVSVEEVIAMLQKGANPQELVAMGVPEEVIMQAIQMLEQAAVQANPEGLGGMAAQGGL